ncbi:Uncharacterized protein Rs2_02107 [Raphanus sativus]|nr:Uncharacterized protein Rs2_02107 [Raphanus sativus]
MYAVGDGALSQLWPVWMILMPVSIQSSMAACGQLVRPFTSDTFFTASILVLICLGIWLCSVLSRVASSSQFWLLLFGFQKPQKERRCSVWLGGDWRRFRALDGYCGNRKASCYSGDVKENPGIQDNKESLTFLRATSKVENGNQYQGISKTN